MSNEIQTVDKNPLVLQMMQDGNMFNSIIEMAKLMASCKVSIPKHFAGNVGDCAAVIMQSMSWGLNPYSVAQKSHVVNGVMGYEAQLIAAVLSNSGLLEKDFDFEYLGDWAKVRVPGWKQEAEAGLGIRVWATRKGEPEPKYHELYLTQVTVRNSPLWKTQPHQQIVYLAEKQWARLWTPGAILGIYSTDELADDYPPKDVTPIKNNADPLAAAAEAAKTKQLENKQEASLYDRLHIIASTKGIDEYKNAWTNLTAKERQDIGEDRHKELKEVAEKASKGDVIDVNAESVNTTTGVIEQTDEGEELLTDHQKDDLLAVLDEKGIKLDTFLKGYNYASLDTIKQSQLDEIYTRLG